MDTGRRWRVETPERVHFHFEVAGMATRLAAWLWDQLFITLIRLLALFGLGWIGGGVFFLLVDFALQAAYFTLWELCADGQSFGKRRMRLRVVADDGGVLTFSKVFLRNLLRPVDMLPLGLLAGQALPLTVLGGAVASFLDRAGRRLGDRVGGTLVVVERPRVLEAPPAALRIRVNSFQSDAALRHRIRARVTREERDLIHDLALRRDQLDEEPRDRLFGEAAAYFRERYGLPTSLSFLSDEQVVLNLSLTLADG